MFDPHDVIDLYLRRGWGPPFPLPAGTKFPPRKGATGHCPDVLPETAYHWAKNGEYGNYGIRLPKGTIAVDWDSTKPLPEDAPRGPHPWVREWLPLAWRATSRGGGSDHAHYFFRVEGEPDEAELLIEKLRDRHFGALNVEVLRHTHRYGVCWPSIHPNTGGMYLWYPPQSEESAEGPPPLEGLPILDRNTLERAMERYSSPSGRTFSGGTSKESCAHPRASKLALALKGVSDFDRDPSSPLQAARSAWEQIKIENETSSLEGLISSGEPWNTTVGSIGLRLMSIASAEWTDLTLEQAIDLIVHHGPTCQKAAEAGLHDHEGRCWSEDDLQSRGNRCLEQHDGGWASPPSVLCWGPPPKGYDLDSIDPPELADICRKLQSELKAAGSLDVIALEVIPQEDSYLEGEYPEFVDVPFSKGPPCLRDRGLAERLVRVTNGRLSYREDRSDGPWLEWRMENGWVATKRPSYSLALMEKGIKVQARSHKENRDKLEAELKQVGNDSAAVLDKIAGISPQEEEEERLKVQHNLWLLLESASGKVDSTAGQNAVLSQAAPLLVMRGVDPPTIVGLPGSPVKVLDLTTLRVRSEAPSDWIFRRAGAAWDPQARCPEFLTLVHRLVGGDEELADFLQVLAGATMIGDNRHQVLVHLCGKAGNGKSTLVELIMKALGALDGATPGYATKGDRKLLTEHQGHSANLGRLREARMVYLDEVEQRISTGLLKGLTDGTPQAAQPGMGKDFVEFTPRWVLWFTSNRELRVSDSSGGFGRRLYRVPVDAPPPTQVDPMLGQRIWETEGPGILRWIAEGANRLLLSGVLPPLPAAMAEARREAVLSANPMLDWLVSAKERGSLVAVSPAEYVTTESLHHEFCRWSQTNDPGTKIMPSLRGFGRALTSIIREEFPSATQGRKGPRNLSSYTGLRMVEVDPVGL